MEKESLHICIGETFLSVSVLTWAVFTLIIWCNSLQLGNNINLRVTWSFPVKSLGVMKSILPDDKIFSTWALSESYICCVSKFGQESSLSWLCQDSGQNYSIELTLLIGSISLGSFVIHFQSNRFFYLLVLSIFHVITNYFFFGDVVWINSGNGLQVLSFEKSKFFSLRRYFESTFQAFESLCFRRSKNLV